MKSLQHRLSQALGLGILGFAVILWLAGTKVLESLTVELLGEQLRTEAEALLAGMFFAADGAPQWPTLSPAFSQPFSGHYYVVRWADGGVSTSRSLWDENLSIAPIKAGSEQIATIRGPRAQMLLARTAGYRKAGHEFTVMVAADMAPLATHRQRLAWIIAGFAVGALLMLMFIQQFVLRAALRPLSDIRKAVTALEAGTIERLVEDVPQEVRPLVSEVNRLLAMLAQRLNRSRHALGNLAHALKTPLQLLLDDLRRSPVPADLAADAREQALEIQRLVERELKRARLAGGGSNPGQRFRLPTDLDELIGTLRQLHRDRKLTLEAEIRTEINAFGEREDLQELLGNLLDNACKWADRCVRISLTGSDTLEVQIADDGPGIGDADWQTMLARGSRLDETRAGHGMGLSIARDIVNAYDGEIDFAPDPQLGGLRVTVRLPVAMV